MKGVDTTRNRGSVDRRAVKREGSVDRRMSHDNFFQAQRTEQKQEFIKFSIEIREKINNKYPPDKNPQTFVAEMPQSEVKPKLLTLGKNDNRFLQMIIPKNEKELENLVTEMKDTKVPLDEIKKRVIDFLPQLINENKINKYLGILLELEGQNASAKPESETLLTSMCKDYLKKNNIPEDFKKIIDDRLKNIEKKDIKDPKAVIRSLDEKLQKKVEIYIELSELIKNYSNFKSYKNNNDDVNSRKILEVKGLDEKKLTPQFMKDVEKQLNDLNKDEQVLFYSRIESDYRTQIENKGFYSFLHDLFFNQKEFNEKKYEENTRGITPTDLHLKIALEQFSDVDDKLKITDFAREKITEEFDLNLKGQEPLDISDLFYFFKDSTFAQTNEKAKFARKELALIKNSYGKIRDSVSKEKRTLTKNEIKVLYTNEINKIEGISNETKNKLNKNADIFIKYILQCQEKSNQSGLDIKKIMFKKKDDINSAEKDLRPTIYGYKDTNLILDLSDLNDKKSKSTEASQQLKKIYKDLAIEFAKNPSISHDELNKKLEDLINSNSDLLTAGISDKLRDKHIKALHDYLSHCHIRAKNSNLKIEDITCEKLSIIETLKHQAEKEKFLSKIKKEESSKYPRSHFGVTDTATKIKDIFIEKHPELEGRNFKIIEVLREFKIIEVLPGEDPNDKQNDQQKYNPIAITRAHSLAVRKLSYISGIMNASHILFPNIKDRMEFEKKLMEFSDLEMAKTDGFEDDLNLNEVTEIKTFLAQFTILLKENLKCDTSKAKKLIQKLERYAVAKNNNQISINHSFINGQETIQMDIPVLNSFTEEQRYEYSSIHNPLIIPKWFKTLLPEEQALLKEMVPKYPREKILSNKEKAKNDAAWKVFEAMGKTSAMTHIPGLTNARINELWVKNEDKWEQVSPPNLKIGTLDPYEIADKGDRKRVIEQNAEQQLNITHKLATNNRAEKWGDLLPVNEKLPLLIFSQSLLSDIPFTADNTYYQNQEAAIDKGAKKYTNTLVISGNDPVNILRHGASYRWEHTEKILSYAENFITKLKIKLKITEKSELTEEILKNNEVLKTLDKNESLKIIENVKLILNAKKQLEEMRYGIPKGTLNKDANFPAMKAALSEILVEAMGGAISTNCKSGKDRTGFDELYRSSMLLYFKQSNKLPSVYDNKDDRKKFVEIFVQLFNTMKTQEGAATNTPGSFGLKDSAMMLCKDIREALGDSYTNSNKRADLNKAGT